MQFLFFLLCSASLAGLIPVQSHLCLSLSESVSLRLKFIHFIANSTRTIKHLLIQRGERTHAQYSYTFIPKRTTYNASAQRNPKENAKKMSTHTLALPSISHSYRHTNTVKFDSVSHKLQLCIQHFGRFCH